MIKVIIDANVFISGLLFGGNPDRILKMWSENNFILCISPQLQAEIINILHNKFKVHEDFSNRFLSGLNEHSQKYIPHSKVKVVRDARDNYLLELAEESQADFLITGDKDLLTLKEYKLTKIISPIEFLQKLI